ncbi:MAG: DNA mismatch endonuclease Vsr [Chitinophagaceae bacterium]|nr:DNA mismatch endonuclease Vsr [Chitinophagaceae bacterium]
MADVHTKEQRSYNMSQIKSGNTKPELLVRRFLHANGFRFRLHGVFRPSSFGEGKGVRLPGKPDIVLPKYKTVIFIHGCFWHGHARCKYFTIPKTRTQWWTNKINTNKANDTKAVKSLRKEGWKVIVLWECQLKKESDEKALKKLIKQLVAEK